ncbi:unnamed protein product, partial [Rotaria magnacalcarata]
MSKSAKFRVLAVECLGNPNKIEFRKTVTREVALKLTKDYFKSLGISNTPGTKWLFSFVVRHGDGIKWKRQQKLERIREISFTEEM